MTGRLQRTYFFRTGDSRMVVLYCMERPGGGLFRWQGWRQTQSFPVALYPAYRG